MPGPLPPPADHARRAARDHRCSGRGVLPGTTLNIPSLVGILIVISVAVNEGILLIEFANQLRERGSRDGAPETW